jgi:hypothetical protein
MKEKREWKMKNKGRILAAAFSAPAQAGLLNKLIVVGGVATAAGAYAAQGKAEPDVAGQASTEDKMAAAAPAQPARAPADSASTPPSGQVIWEVLMGRPGFCPAFFGRKASTSDAVFDCLLLSGNAIRQGRNT